MNGINNIALLASLPLCLAFVPALPYIAIAIGVWYYRKSLIKWLSTDTCRDVIVPLGPKQAGKSELRDAIMGNPYNEGRIGTTTTTCGKFQLGEKWFVDIPDGGGDENIIKANREHLVFAYRFRSGVGERDDTGCHGGTTRCAYDKCKNSITGHIIFPFGCGQ